MLSSSRSQGIKSSIERLDIELSTPYAHELARTTLGEGSEYKTDAERIGRVVLNVLNGSRVVVD